MPNRPVLPEEAPANRHSSREASRLKAILSIPLGQKLKGPGRRSMASRNPSWIHNQWRTRKRSDEVAALHLERALTEFFAPAQLDDSHVVLFLAQAQSMQQQPYAEHLALYTHVGKVFPHVSPLAKVAKIIFELQHMTRYAPLPDDKMQALAAKHVFLEAEFKKRPVKDRFYDSGDRRKMGDCLFRVLRVLAISPAELVEIAEVRATFRGDRHVMNYLANAYIAWCLLSCLDHVPVLFAPGTQERASHRLRLENKFRWLANRILAGTTSFNNSGHVVWDSKRRFAGLNSASTRRMISRWITEAVTKSNHGATLSAKEEISYVLDKSDRGLRRTFLYDRIYAAYKEDEQAGRIKGLTRDSAAVKAIAYLRFLRRLEAQKRLKIDYLWSLTEEEVLAKYLLDARASGDKPSFTELAGLLPGRSKESIRQRCRDNGERVLEVIRVLEWSMETDPDELPDYWDRRVIQTATGDEEDDDEADGANGEAEDISIGEEYDRLRSLITGPPAEELSILQLRRSARALASRPLPAKPAPFQGVTGDLLRLGNQWDNLRYRARTLVDHSADVTAFAQEIVEFERELFSA